ncbi:hypothetical protein AKJ09_07561 [Labilithrix luteola]|uniref:Uncharacterized protein n=1 Tax=Labilithrix luteola TaxID=1391654 RepID=A0A0K1Q588_9BACT|nr:hypothetical protein AKJ09_07561 [Labilithrix luteola]
MAAVVLAFAGVVACNKDEAKPIPQEEKKASPVPSDMVFNDFVPQGGGGGNLAVRVDGGALEAGVGEAAGDASSAGGGAETATAAAKPNVTDPGAEPRAVRKYAFAANKPEKRVLTIRQTISQGPQQQQAPSIQLTVEFTAKEVKPTGARFEVKLLKVDLADKADPQLAQMVQQQFGQFAGLTGTFQISPFGEVGEVSMAGSEKMQREGAAEILGMFQQVVELAVPPLPEAPIGVGAKWEHAEHGAEGGENAARKLELKELTPEGGTITASLEMKVPKRAIPDPRAKGATVEINASGNYTYAFRFDRIATKVTGDQVQKQSIEVPTSPDPKAPKQTIVKEAKSKYTMEAPGSEPKK